MLTITTPASILPTTLDAVRLELKLHSTDTSENTPITDKIKTAALEYERLYGHTLTATTYTWLVECPSERLPLPRYPVASITSIHQLEDDYTTWTALTGHHLVGNTIFFDELPEARLHRVVFVAGVASQDLVPIDVQIAIREAACHLHRCRESHTTETLKELALGWATIARQNQRIIS